MQRAAGRLLKQRRHLDIVEVPIYSRASVGIVLSGAAMVNSERVVEAFQRHYAGRQPHVIARAPGRINLIGEHTDYNDGYVLPIAIQQGLCVAARRREDDRMRVYSRSMDVLAEWRLDGSLEPGQPDWANYCKGVSALLLRRGVDVPGADLLLDGDLPVGGGLSSSAALEVGTAKALLGLAEEVLPGMELATLCREAEHQYAGTPCGIMDQLICLLGKAGHALLIDCQTCEHDHIPLSGNGIDITMINTQVKHKLGESEYPVRQAQCREALAYFHRQDATVASFRDVTEAMYEDHAARMDPVLSKRTRHVIRESHRVLHAVEALKSGAIHEFGQLMVESHRSLKEDYEVSCPELDAVVEIASSVNGVYGARMTGGGFGGCVVALVRESATEALRSALAEHYDRTFSKPALVMTTQASDGASLLQI